MENIFLAARSYGVGSVWINQMQNIHDRPAVRALLNEIGVPADHVIYGVARPGLCGSLRTGGAQGAHRKSRICKIARKTPPGNAVNTPSPEEFLEISTMVPCGSRLALSIMKLGKP